MAADLFTQARAALAALPDFAVPRLLASIARDEYRLAPAQSLADDERAFADARNLAGPQGADETAGAARELVKQQVELSAISDIARHRESDHGEFDRALELTRLADVPKGPLYDALIMAVSGADGADDDPASPAGADAGERVFDLVEECKRADGVYPYRGVANALRRLARATDTTTRLLLVREGYQMAANLSDPNQANQAYFFLQAAHHAEPALDGELESSLQSLIRNLASASNADTIGTASATSHRLLSLLGTVDPVRALALGANLTDLVPPPTTLRPGSFELNISSVSGGLTFVANVNSTTPLDAAPPADAATLADNAAFTTLLAQAESLQRRDPRQALSLADEASNHVNSTLLSSQLDAVGRLAAIYYQLGSHQQGAHIFSLALDAADQQARAQDADFQSADRVRQLQIAASLDSPASPLVELYSLAARFDFPNTARRAETAQFTLLKPTLLLRLAVIAGVSERPVRVLRQ